jgi:hypothetical protein
MKSRLLSYLIITFSLCVLPFSLLCQITVSKANGQPPQGEVQGFYYALPRTVLKVDLTVEKLEQLRGPLAVYTENYLGTSDYISSNRNKYSILEVNVETLFEADPEQVYYVQFPLERSKEEKVLTFHLSEKGTLLAINDEKTSQTGQESVVDQTIIVMEGDDDFRYQPDYHRKKKIDTITRRVTIDTVSIERFIFKTSWVDKSDEDKANEAALQIANIRDARFNLLSGYQEVNYGESIRYMDMRLAEMERQYLELFLGKEVKTYETITVYFLPQKNNVNNTLTTLPGNAAIDISINPRGNTSNIPETTASAANSIYYRIPELADVEISHDGKVHFRESMVIGQMGVISTAPINDTRTQFDPNTGTLTKMVKE